MRENYIPKHSCITATSWLHDIRKTLCLYACAAPLVYIHLYIIFIADTSCPPRDDRHVCVINGSSPIITLTYEGHIIYDWPYSEKWRTLSNFTIHGDFRIYNVTPDDAGNYLCKVYYQKRVTLLVASKWWLILWLININTSGYYLLVYSTLTILMSNSLKAVYNDSIIGI